MVTMWEFILYQIVQWYLRIGGNFLHTKFRHSKLSTFLIFPPPQCAFSTPAVLPRVALTVVLRPNTNDTHVPYTSRTISLTDQPFFQGLPSLRLLLLLLIANPLPQGSARKQWSRPIRSPLSHGPLHIPQPPIPRRSAPFDAHPIPPPIPLRRHQTPPAPGSLSSTPSSRPYTREKAPFPNCLHGVSPTPSSLWTPHRPRQGVPTRNPAMPLPRGLLNRCRCLALTFPARKPHHLRPSPPFHGRTTFHSPPHTRHATLLLQGSDLKWWMRIPCPVVSHVRQPSPHPTRWCGRVPIPCTTRPALRLRWGPGHRPPRALTGRVYRS